MYASVLSIRLGTEMKWVLDETVLVSGEGDERVCITR
jgi:hypothetical protein